jgi:stage II sporulation protein Q
MNEGNKTPRKIEESTKSVAESSAVRPSGWKRLLSKRWVFPAAYMAAAAIIVAILWMNSGTGQKDSQTAVPGVTDVDNSTAGQSSAAALEAAANGETLQWPVAKLEDMDTKMAFYDEKASEEQRQAALVEYNQQFIPHMAVDLARKDSKEFEVLAAMSGKVSVAEQNTVNGYEVQIEHPNGLVTVYQSLKDLQVKVGDEVEQGDLIATAGESELEPTEGIHVHFEVHNDGKSVDPASLIKAKK